MKYGPTGPLSGNAWPTSKNDDKHKKTSSNPFFAKAEVGSLLNDKDVNDSLLAFSQSSKRDIQDKAMDLRYQLKVAVKLSHIKRDKFMDIITGKKDATTTNKKAADKKSNGKKTRTETPNF